MLLLQPRVMLLILVICTSSDILSCFGFSNRTRGIYTGGSTTYSAE